ncbi:Transcriptional regulator MerR family [Paramagnetospirillum magnetotacticum MS-1]|uniref:Transcriptional regulator MerR family n=1 Tax=Paramagnetospirillum magnetotacticum MS-1 TaxID=272627 RepID=A0A0C2YVR5_PARME|nr:MerR family transcriptional regulator [Paramagnetospirillum magnetotacticum]KIL98800.1 Transcriptional regulator MerR family [Paramagnetospirillum magnetotacticum MS-1]
MTGDEGDDSSARRNGKSEAAFRTISEVADDLDVPQHVLRFWEGKFPQVKPLKRGGGRRYYRPDDVALLRRIRDLLYAEGYTIKGVQKLLKEGGGKDAPAQASPARAAEPELLLGLDQPDDHDEDDEADDLVIEDDESRHAVVRTIIAGGDDLPAAPGGLSPTLRHELEDILAELEQLRALLQGR